MIKKHSLSLVHEVLPPVDKVDKPKLILLLHGYGSHEQDLFSFASSLNKKRMVISIRGPISLPFGGFAWYPLDFSSTPDRWSDNEEALRSIDKVESFLDEAIKAYGLDPEEITLMGFSQGCILSYSLMFRNPEKIRFLVAMSGYLHQPILPDRSTNNLLTTRILITHGTQDDLIPVEWARRSSEALEQLKVPHQFREYPMGHGITPDCLHDILDWMRNEGVL